jgi:cob(I)alamin adenosyltransferase
MPARPNSENPPVRGLVVLFTGNGKGKTSAAMGILARSSGQGLRVGVIQFIKSPGLTYGEAITARQLHIPFQSMGDGFVLSHPECSPAREAAQAAWAEAQRWICDQTYDIIILDEITYLFAFHWLDVQETIAWLKTHKPPAMHLVMTGRNAPAELIDYADLVTEMQEIKHPFRQQGLPAQAGVDY